MCGFNKENFAEMEFGESKESKLISPFQKHISVTLDMQKGTLLGWDTLWEQIDIEDKHRRNLEAEMRDNAANLVKRKTNVDNYIEPGKYRIIEKGNNEFILEHKTEAGKDKIIKV